MMTVVWSAEGSPARNRYMEQLRVAFYYLIGDPLGSETGTTGDRSRRLVLEMQSKRAIPPVANLPLAEAMGARKESLLESFQELHFLVDQL